MGKYIVKVGKMYVSADSRYGISGEDETIIMEISSNADEAEEYSDLGKAREIKDAIGGAIFEKKIVESLVLVEDVTAHEHVFETESVFENVRKIQKVEENARLRGKPTQEI